MIGLLGLFVSSFSRSSIHALMMTGVLGVLLGVAVAEVAEGSKDFAWWAFDLNAFWHGVGLSRFNYSALRWTDRAATTVLVGTVCLVAMLLTRFGLRNHRSADTPVLVVTRQVVWLLAACTVGAALIGGGEPLLLYYLATH